MPTSPHPILAAALAVGLTPVALQAEPLPVHGLQLPASLTGTLPCADCEGIRHHLDLWPDQTFALSREWLGREDGPYREDAMGRWHADPRRNAIVLQGLGDAPAFWQVTGPDRLRQMDMAGEPIVSDLDYGLVAGEFAPVDLTGLTLAGLYWQVVEFDGAPAPALDGRPAPYVALQDSPDDHRFSATLGCNRMIGGYSIEGNALRFDAVASTRMACPPPLDMAEGSFATMLSEVRSYRLNGRDLQLLDDEGEVLARLIAVFMP